MTDPDFMIETPRLRLSYFQANNISHCDWLVEIYNTPEFISSNGGKTTSITSREAARHQLTTVYPEEHARNRYGRYLISEKPLPPATNSGADDAESMAVGLPSQLDYVGIVTLMKGSGANAYTVPDLGFVVHPSKTRQGYAKEAARALLDYVAENLGIREVLGLCDVENEASNGVFRSLGFTRRGVRELKVFGGKKGMVWTSPGMSEDLHVYGF